MREVDALIARQREPGVVLEIVVAIAFVVVSLGAIRVFQRASDDVSGEGMSRHDTARVLVPEQMHWIPIG